MNKTFRIRFYSSISICLFAFLVNNLQSDIIELKNGQKFENVKVNITITSIEFTHQGKRVSLEKSEVKRIKLKPVIVETIKDPIDSEVEKEKKEEEIKKTPVEEKPEIEESPSEKETDTTAPILLLRFTSGEGITQDELAIVVNRVKKELATIKHFEIVDDSEFSKNCPKETEDCQNTNSSNNKARKIVSSVITKIENSYFINGNILDTKNDTVDFSESSIAKSVDKLDDAADDFSKKLVDTITGNKDDIAESKGMQYIWRSALFPGWGQYHYATEKEKKYSLWKGVGFATIFFLASIDTYSSYNKLKKEESNYKSFHNLFFLYPSGGIVEQAMFIEDGQKSLALQNSAQYLMTKIYFLCFVYLVNIVDIFFPQNYFLGFGNTKTINDTPSKKLEANPESESQPVPNASFLIIPEKNQYISPEASSVNPYFLFSYRWRF